MKQKYHLWRLCFIGGLFVVIMLLLFWKIANLAVIDRSFLKNQGDARSLRVVKTLAYRGMIVDRQGSALAVSTKVKSIWVNPKDFQPSKSKFIRLANILRIKPQDLVHNLRQHRNKDFVYLQRQIPPDEASRIAALKIPGINFQDEFKRYYPEIDSTAQLLGFTNIDDNGLEGIELAFNHWLVGVSGQKKVIKDRLGHIISEVMVLSEPQPGHTLKLSIDRRIQFFAYAELKNTLEKFQATSGSIIVLDVKTGEVLASVNAPSFNPNARQNYPLDSYRNKVFTDTFEPGSIIKPFSVAAALETGKFTPQSIIETNPGWFNVDGKIVRDVHNYGTLDVTGILLHSSNIGVTKLSLASPADQLLNFLSKVGLAQKTESGYPGESEGSIVKLRDANPFVLATLSFGYGMAVTAAQIAKAYMVFANHGELLPIRLVHSDKIPAGTQVLSQKIADEILAMLETTVEDGTGRSARISGYRVAGKTGTARIAGKKGYEEKRYMSSFVGIAPVSNPRIVVAVFINDPRRSGYYGAQVAAPLFASVMGNALRILYVPPDK
jgi:cell division protein FtsI (penicillin-binding protein 3)